ncbi:hypothetical protein [Pseudogemmobacter humi]|uniref:hypothetical protein n=1 Tax=Pseudogemmobacter humi TaxID=2483812 RepID=UPI0018EFDC0C|nr:hypothetical protein [Pseudogemmobacter humi]
MKLPFFAFVRGLGPPLTFCLPVSSSVAPVMPGISWSGKGNVGEGWQYLVRGAAGKQHMVAFFPAHKTISMGSQPCDLQYIAKTIPAHLIPEDRKIFFNSGPEAYDRRAKSAIPSSAPGGTGCFARSIP